MDSLRLAVLKLRSNSELLYSDLKWGGNLYISFLRSRVGNKNINSYTRFLRTMKTFAIYATWPRDKSISREGCIWLLPGGNRRPPSDYYHRCVSSDEDTTVGFLSRAVASYVFDEATRKNVAVAFSPRVGKKEEREIHWRYGLVCARVERTTCGKKKGRKERKEEKKERFLLGSFLHPLSGAPKSRGRKRLGLFAPPNLLSSKRSGLSQTSNGAKRELSPKYSRISWKERLLLLSWRVKVPLKDSHERLQTVSVICRFSNRMMTESMWHLTILISA